MPINSLSEKELKKIKVNSKAGNINSAEYFNFCGVKLGKYPNLDILRIERLAKIIRGLIFATVENAQSGHPGGSSSKVEQFLALTLGGQLGFDPMEPKHPGRDRVVWSAGHCTPLLFSGQALYYEALRRLGRQFSEAVTNCVLPEHLLNFRRPHGPPGHAESKYPFSDYCTGPSGHGFCAAGGMAISHGASGLPTKIWVFMGDAESEEGMTFEARNVLAATGTDNIIVTLDYNHFGIDGPVEEVISAPYVNYWLGLGWNVIEADGHDVNQLMHAYNLAVNFKNKKPTVVIAHTKKGKLYGDLENSATSHGVPIEHEKYVRLMHKLGFKIRGEKGRAVDDLEKVLEYLSDSDCEFIETRLNESAKKIETEAELLLRMKKNLSGRALVNPLEIERPKNLPKELCFKEGDKVSLRAAASAWFEWLMKQTAFFYSGAGDLAKSVLTNKSEQIFGLIKPTNKYGRGIRFGIAEANMAMMSMAMTQDILPGGFKPVSVFGTYGVFSALYAHPVHLALINNAVNPNSAGFFIALATHDGPETGEDGPTHQGLFWTSIFKSYPGIKLYKPADAAETIEILFAALNKGEPIVLALPRIETAILERKSGVSRPELAVQGAYVYKDYLNNGKPKAAIAVAGAITLENALKALPSVISRLDIKIVVVTSPQAFLDMEKNEPDKAAAIISENERESLITLHNGWDGFMDDFQLSSKALARKFGVNRFMPSGKYGEVITAAGLDPASIAEKIISFFD